jgi:uncharacterized protein
MKLSRTLYTIAVAMSLVAAPIAHAQSTPVAASSTTADTRVVYHITEAASMRDALNNVTNQMNTTPNARITVLANARGVFSLVNGERDRQGDYAGAISSLQAKGVKFVACSMSMSKNNVDPSSLLPNVTTVPAGVVELTRLQTLEQYAYIKP